MHALGVPVAFVLVALDATPRARAAMGETCAVDIMHAPIPGIVRPAAAAPWLAVGAFAPAPLETLVADIEQAPIERCEIVKAFQPRNSADQFASRSAPVQWVCEREECGLHAGRPGATLIETVAHAQAPLAARVASDGGDRAVAPTLECWLGSLRSATGRCPADADAYLTDARFPSASVGWHVDDIDVLLVMMRGSKRFRVAGSALGSRVVIDRILRPGDAVYIPALTFHTGGSSDEGAEARSDSALLSVAFELPDEENGGAASEAVAHWRAARRAILDRLPDADCNRWGWAGGEGSPLVRRICGANADWRRFAAADELQEAGAPL